MYTKTFNKIKELRDFVNEKKISKENIITVFESEGAFTVIYYAE